MFCGWLFLTHGMKTRHVFVLCFSQETISVFRFWIFYFSEEQQQRKESFSSQFTRFRLALIWFLSILWTQKGICILKFYFVFYRIHEACHKSIEYSGNKLNYSSWDQQGVIHSSFFSYFYISHDNGTHAYHTKNGLKRISQSFRIEHAEDIHNFQLIESAKKMQIITPFAIYSNFNRNEWFATYTLHPLFFKNNTEIAKMISPNIIPSM